MKLGFIGYGNMASAIISGILSAGMQAPSDIYIIEHMAQKSAEAKAKGLQVAENLGILVNCVDLIFLCVKPKDFAQLLTLLSSANYPKKPFVSIAAGVNIDTMAKYLGEETPLVRAMPNTPLLLGCGTTALCRNNAVSDEVFAYIKQIFGSAGTVYDIPEEQFDAVINLNGSSPAYIYLIAKTVAEYTSKNNAIPYDICMSMFCDTMAGSAKMLLETGKSPDELIQMVSSPGGTTVAALEAFEKTGLVSSLESGFDACITRAKELSQN